MAINASVQYNDGFLPRHDTVDLMLLSLWKNPIECHEEIFLSLQPMFPPKRFDIVSPCLGGAQKV